jgi:aspartate aminotransferase-like enzyme
MSIKLFIPGPVTVREDVLQKMATQQMGHRSKAASDLQRSITEKMRKVMFTEGAIVLSTSSGSGLMEAAVRSCTAKKAAVFSVGAFGDRWYKMCTANGIPADKFTSAPGQPTTPEMVEEALKTGQYDLVTVTHNETSSGIQNPVEAIGEVVKKYPGVIYCVDTVSSMGGSKLEVDKAGIDVCITSTQKCLGLPAGLAIASVSDKAIERARTVPNRGLYFDLVELYDYIIKKDHQYPSTPSLSHMFALDYQLDQIVNVEGVENRFKRHEEMANVVRAWAVKYFDLFAAEGYLSKTLTVIKNTRGIDVSALNKELKARGFEIANGYGDNKDITFRIAHMADTTMEEVHAVLGHIEDILGLK